MAKRKAEQLSLEPEPPAELAQAPGKGQVRKPSPRVEESAAKASAAPSATGEPAAPAPPSGPAATSAPSEPAKPESAEPVRVVELVNAHDGCWKRLSTGEKVPLSEKEWQLELSRLLARKAAPEAVATAEAKPERGKP